MKTDYRDLSSGADHDVTRDVLTQCFAFGRGGDSAAAWAEYTGIVGLDNFRCLEVDGTVVAGLCTYPMGQWFGGRSVSMHGVAAVGVLPEARGGGVGRILMSELLGELQGAGVALSTLYASTQTLYRRVGFEQAGSCVDYTIPLGRIGVADRDLPVERIEPGDASMREAYDARARSYAGHPDRSEALWTRVTRTRKNDVYCYRLGEPGDAEGYVIFEQAPRPDGLYDLKVRDLAANTPAATRRVWSLLADHRSLAETVSWPGPAVEPLLGALGEMRAATVVGQERWMLRVVDVARALALRGYHGHIVDELHLDVSDDLLPDNRGRWVLSVSDGRGEVERGGKGAVRVTARGLAALYSGFLCVGQLGRLGWIRGTTNGLAVADRVFAGPESWMSDRF